MVAVPCFWRTAMDSRKNSQMPRRLARAAARFAAWRRTHVPHSRIPKFLWTAAVKLAAELGVSYTAIRLRLNYYDLKKHVGTTAPPSREVSVAKQIPSFVELPVSAFPTFSECVIEPEH